MDKDEYLDMLPEDEKLFFSMFYKRFHYLIQLDSNVGIGNYNSKICVIIDNHKDKIESVKFIRDNLFNDINISLWNVYITCRIKNDNFSEEKFNKELACELSAVQPKIVFYFTKDKKSFETEKKNETEYIYINTDDIKTDDEKKFKQIVNRLKKYSLKLVLLRDIE